MSRENSRENDESIGATLDYLLTFTKGYLAHGLLKWIKFQQDHISKIKALRKEYKVLKKENKTLENSCESLYTKINDLESEKTTLQHICDDPHKSLLKRSKG